MKFSSLFKKDNLNNNSIQIYDFELIGRYFRNRKSAEGQIITDNIACDIDLDETFEKIDNTNSKIGQQYLYAKIRTICGKESLLKFNELVSEFEKDNLLLVKAKKILGKLTSTDGYYFEELFQGKHVKLTKLTLPYLSLATVLAFIFLSFFKSFFLLLLIPVFILNAVLHYYNKRNVLYYFWSVSELRKTMKAAKHLVSDEKIKKHFGNTLFLKDLVKAERKSAFITFERKYDGDITAVLFLFVELIKISVNFEVIFFHHYLTDLIKKRESLDSLFNFIGEVDSAASVAELKIFEECVCEPCFVESKHINIKGIVHPLVDDCVPNAINLPNKSLLLTGSNMSGKTTFIRAITINAILAQTIFCCFAKEYEAPYFKIFTSIRISDSVLNNTSYFLEELLVIKNFIDHSADKEHCLFVLDEIFKGTNTLERISASKSILSFLNKGKHIVLASTHDIELTDFLENDNYASYHFCEQIINNELVFDYKIHEGKLKTKNAIKILELYNFPSDVINDAIETQTHILNNKISYNA